MRKKLLLITFTVLLATTVVGCGSETSDEAKEISFENIETFEIPVEEGNTTVEEENLTEGVENPTEEKENELTETAVEESEDFTFADLAVRQFEFSSGAGGWSEEFIIEKDGYFTGNYHDSDMGDIGEGYANGTFYSSSYSGHFTDLTKINDYTYQMKLADISYKETADTEEIKDNIRYIYTESYCLGGTDTFKIYLPGTPLGELSEEVYNWIAVANQNEEELTVTVIVDETNGYGIYSYDRLTPLEDAQMTFNTYKESYDYYNEKFLEAGTTLEMVESTGAMYELSDDCLNYIWNLIRYNVEEDKYNEILAEQRAWIADKEAKAEEIRVTYEGGSLAPVNYNSTLAALTIERCEVLIEYLK